MGMTMTEKILAAHAGREKVAPGQNIWVNVDVLMTHDVCGPGTFGIFKKQFGPDAKVWDPEKIVLIPDHYIFTTDPHANRNLEILRTIAKEQNLKYFYDAHSPAYKGVCHVALPQEGHTRPGEILIGTDSHTCTAGAFGEFATGVGNTDAALVLGTGKIWLKVPPTMRFIFDGPPPPYLMAKDLILHIIGEIGVDGATYRAMEFAGDGVLALKVEERMTLCNMAIEAGGKNGIIEPDDITLAYVKKRTDKPFTVVKNDEDASYYSERVFKSADIQPTVARPHSPENRATARELAGTKITHAYIGSCTGGKITDMQAAARVLLGRKTAVPTFVVPATMEVARAMEHEKVDGATLKQVFESAGAQIAPPSCAACLGGPPDTFGRLNGREICISTTNRNFPGRMGSKESQVFLASPYTVAASAVRGRITDPREFL
ncbi:MAG TPA: 3-isopropylmalate dehydratase large subunit [bacterium]|nr:3-isopropylmalate dehydratase large subunit [bacterium]HQL61493.1 3-isopropylmalate dehydratase large subunit [bacterium]